MKQLLRIFDNKPVRVVLVKNEPWFVAQDVSEALGFDRPRNGYRMIDPEDKGAHLVRTLRGDQEMTTVQEGK